MFGRLAAGNGLREIDVLLTSIVLRRNVFLPHELRIAGRNVHGDVVHQFFEVFGARYEIAFAVDLDQHANLAAGVNVVAYRTFAGHTRCLLGRHGHTFFA